MERSAVYLIFVTLFFGIAGGLFMGLNQGISLAETHGTMQACDMLRWSIYDCSKFTR